MLWTPIIFPMKPIDHEFFHTEPNAYMVTPNGDIYSNKSHRFLNPSPSSTTGYYFLRLSDGRAIAYHRITARAYVDGYSEINNCVNHLDGDKTNTKYTNLEWTDKAGNNRHAYATGLNNYVGENCKDAKLTNDQVEKICQLLEQNYSYKDILSIMGIEYTQTNYEIIRSIRTRKAWNCVSNKYNFNSEKLRAPGLTDEDIHLACKCFEQGMYPGEAFEVVYGHKCNYKDQSDYNRYSRLATLKNKKSYANISNQYNF